MADIEGYSEVNDFATFLLDHSSVDNNIFSYNLIRKVKLISIPNEIFIYHKDDLENPVPNGTIINEGNYVLLQNKKVNKTFELYKLDYQFLVEEPTHNTFFKNASEFVLLVLVIILLIIIAILIFFMKIVSLKDFILILK